MKFCYAARKSSVRQGVALLKVDDDAKLWNREGEAGWQIDGMQNIIGVHSDGVNIRARLDRLYTCPRDLNGMKVFYQFYRNVDRNGKNRPYLYLAGSTANAYYAGHRLIIISREGVFLVPEPRLRTLFSEYRQQQPDREESHSYADYTLDELDMMEESLFRRTG